MNKYKYIKIATVLLGLASVIGCTKLDQSLNNTLTQKEAASTFSASLFLQSAYNDCGVPFSDLGNLFALQEVVTDECLVPTRGGDWDDNGKWRALHFHSWTTDNVDIFLDQFNKLNKISFDATNVMTPAYNANASQIAQARFLRALALYHILDLWNQFPFRNAGDNLLNAPTVYRGDSAVQFIIGELNAVIPALADGGPGVGISAANKDAARVLLMRLYLNRGAFNNRENPTFDDADMQKVISIGDTIINSGKYSYNSSYFSNFAINNQGSPEGIFALQNKSGVSTNNTGISNRWFATLHYNQYYKLAPAAGWNGFSTVAQTYSSFAVNGATATLTSADTALDERLGGRFFSGCTDSSGLRPGFLIGQQYQDKEGVISKLTDRKVPANLLIFDPNISATLKETGNNLELTGIRVAKYPPDYTLNEVSYGTPGNWMMIFRYPEVVLMVAEAKMRAASADNAGALDLVNDLRAARGATALTSMILNDASDVYAPNTLLAERGRELYWESVRRTDLIRFKLFSAAWAYKEQDANTNFYLFPIPSSALAANPNLQQNPGF